MPERLRIFISSPGDVAEERLRAHLVIQKLARDFARWFRIEAYLWEHEPMLASGHFQDAIEPPSACDVVLLIVYSRLGTPLPERSGQREYRGIDGRAPVTGTEWEYEEALAASRARGAPDLLAYRKLGDPGASLADAQRRAEQERQWNLLEGFWKRHFEDAGMFFAGSAKFRSLEEFDAKLEADLTALIERRIAAARKAGTADAVAAYRGNPYQGLASYDFEQAAVFFGRDAQTRAAVTRLQHAAEAGTAFLFVAGGSGSGKSSLARAGVAPSIVAPKAVPGVGLWRRVVTRPADGGDDPILGLAKALLAGDPAEGVGLRELAGAGGDAGSLAAHLKAAAGDPSFPFRTALERLAGDARARGTMLAHEEARLLLVVDQLEELFGPRIGAADRDAYAQILAGLARSGLVWVVATMRSDLWHRVAETKLLRDLVEAGARLDLGVPDGAEILEMVRRPALAAGLRFETDSESGVGLDAAIAHAAAEDAGALPLLSVMLHALYLRDIVGAEGTADTLTFATYRALGELKGAIARRAEETLDALRRDDSEAAASLPVVLRALVSVAAERNTVTARVARLDQFTAGGPEARLVAAFAAPDARLFIVSANAGAAEVRVAHEALLSHWPRARDQIATDRRDLETRSRLEAMQHRWREAANPRERSQSLLAGLNLAEGRDLVARWRLQATPLGTYVAQSANAAALRRRALAIAASVLIAVFAGLSLVAGFSALRARQAANVADEQRSRAEDQRQAAELERARADAERQSALAAQAESERQAAAAEAERQRADAERQRATQAADEASAERARALAALDATKRESARTLASQTALALSGSDVTGALALAVQAATLEADILKPGDAAASTPALLQAMAAVRQELHIERPPVGRGFPYAFVGDDALAYVDPDAGLVIVGLDGEASVRLRVALPERILPTQIAVLEKLGRIAVTGLHVVEIVEADSGRVRYQATLDGEITALDASAATGFVALGAGNAVTLIGPDATGAPTMIPVPAPRAGVSVGQVRFSGDGKVLYVTYGADVLRYDIAAGSFAPAPVAALSAAPVGGDAATLEQLLATGRIVVTELMPDLRSPTRVMMSGQLALSDLDLATGATQTFAPPDPAFAFVGIDNTDFARAGTPQEMVAVMSRVRDRQRDLTLAFIDEGGTLLPFDAFSYVADDMSGEKPFSCAMSPHGGHVACHYWGDSAEGLVVWRVNGGAHGFQRTLDRDRVAGIAVAGDVTLTLTTEGELMVSAGGRDTVAATPGKGWTLTAFDGRIASAWSAETKSVHLWRYEAAGRLLAPVATIAAAGPAIVSRDSTQALVPGEGGLTLVDLATGATVWSAGAASGAVAAAFSPDGVAVVTADAAMILDAWTGAVRRSHVLARDADTPLALDAGGRSAAFIADGALHITDIASGARRDVDLSGATASVLAWSPDGTRLFVGARDGAVLAFGQDGAALWSLASPLGKSFSEDGAWPAQPPKGTVLQLAIDPTGERLAVVRQDMPALDIAEAASGRALTALTPPWTYGVPASVTLPDARRVVTAWAVHPLTRATPTRVSVHDLPAKFEDVLAEARAALGRLRNVWGPAGQ